MNEFDPPPVRTTGAPDPGGGRSPRPGRRAVPIVIGLGLAAAAIFFAVHGIHITGASAAGGGATAAATPSFSVVQASTPAPPATTSAITARVDPGLVNIDVSNRTTGLRGQATGMVLTPSGVVLTNNHVVQGATGITATDVGNGRTYTRERGGLRPERRRRRDPVARGERPADRSTGRLVHGVGLGQGAGARQRRRRRRHAPSGQGIGHRAPSSRSSRATSAAAMPSGCTA